VYLIAVRLMRQVSVELTGLCKKLVYQTALALSETQE
jgi:hypothetical protein